MKYRKLYDGTEIPVLGLGTWKMGGQMEADRSNDSAYIAAIQTALELGYRHIDTAEMYGAGHTEEIVGKVIQDFDRKELFITSKIWSNHLTYEGVLEAFNGSTQRLGTDYLDLYLIHWPKPEMDLEGTIKGMNQLVQEKKVKYIGVSNFMLDDLKRAKELSQVPLITDQMHYNLLIREPEESGVLDFCTENNMFVTAYQPLERGKVLGLPLVEELAKKYDKTPGQIALNWLVSNPSVITIPMATKKEHLQKNLDVLEFEMEKEDLEKLSAFTK